MIPMPRNPSAHEARAKVMKALENSVPLSALVGAGDLVLERLRSLSADVAGRASHFDPPHFDPGAFRAPKLDPKAMDPRGVDVARLAAEVKDLATKAQQVAAQYVSVLGDQVKDAPDDAPALPTKVQAAFSDLVSGAVALYGELAGRGHQVVREAGAATGDVSTEPLSAEGVRAAESAQVRPATKRPVKKSTVKKATVKKATGKKAAAKKATGKKAAAKKATVVKKTPARPAAAPTPSMTAASSAPTSTTSSPAANVRAKASAVQRPTVQKTPVQKTAVRKTAVKKTAAKKAPAPGTSPGMTDQARTTGDHTSQPSVPPGPTTS
jgi:hypothetical protein